MFNSGITVTSLHGVLRDKITVMGLYHCTTFGSMRRLRINITNCCSFREILICTMCVGACVCVCVCHAVFSKTITVRHFFIEEES